MSEQINVKEKQVYDAEDISAMLQLCRSKTYNFLNEVLESAKPPFRVLKIGRLLRVPKKDFDEWLLGIGEL